jgi:hypothetical protein
LSSLLFGRIYKKVYFEKGEEGEEEKGSKEGCLVCFLLIVL